MLHLDPLAPRTPRLPHRRLGALTQLTASIALHVTVVVIAASIATTSAPVIEARAGRIRPPTSDIRHIVFLASEVPRIGGGGGGGGNRQPEPIRRAQGVGSDSMTLRVRKGPSPTAAPVTTASAPSRRGRSSAPIDRARGEAAGLRPLRADWIADRRRDVRHVDRSRIRRRRRHRNRDRHWPGTRARPRARIGRRNRRWRLPPGGAVSAPRLIKEVKPKYTSEALRNKIQGTVVLEAIVTGDGCASQIRIVRSLDRGGLDEEALTAVAQWRFEPGRLAGAPVDVLVTIDARLLDSLTAVTQRPPGGGNQMADVSRFPSMLIHEQLPLDAAFATLRSAPAGLSQADAAARRLEFGPNRIERLAEPLSRFAFSASSPTSSPALLWVAALLALIADWWMPGQGMATLAAAIVAVIAINGAFSFWQEYRAEETMAALQRLLPHQVRALRNGTTVALPSEDVVPGDVIFLSAGDDVPADCRLIEGFGVRVNNATITGEARPVSRDARPSTETDLLRSRNVLLAGTSVTTGEAKALVFATGMHTAFGKIAHLTQTTADPPSPLQKEIAALSRVIAALAVTIGLVVFVIGRFIGLSTSVSIVFAIGIIVANVPEGLLPTVTLAMALAARRMGKRHTLVRHLPSVETLGCASVICTDKTGTLTLNRMEIRSIYVDDAFVDPRAAETAAFAASHRRLFECAACCHDLKDAGESGHHRWIGDPMELALARMASTALGDAAAFDRIDEIPFEPERKRLVTLHRVAGEPVAFVKGAPEAVLSRANWIEVDGGGVALSVEQREAFGKAATAMADRGLRVLALAYRVLPANYVLADAEQDLVVTALVGFEDPPRPEVPAAVASMP